MGNYQCYSGVCGASGRCVGIQSGQPCTSSVQCDIGLGCFPQPTFPFITQCSPLYTASQSCRKTSECVQGLICWPLTVADAKTQNNTCQPAFSQPLNSVIGYMNNQSMTALQNSVNVGQNCVSGIAKIINATAAMCVNISRVSTNLDSYISSQASPYYCDLSVNYSTPQGCKYMFTYPNKTISTIADDYCECSLDPNMTANNQGICPFPGQAQLQTYVNALSYSLQNSQCHNMDWNNWQAQLECGIGTSEFS